MLVLYNRNDDEYIHIYFIESLSASSPKGYLPATDANSNEKVQFFSNN